MSFLLFGFTSKDRRVLYISPNEDFSVFQLRRFRDVECPDWMYQRTYDA